MSTLKTTNIQHASAASAAIVLASDGSATASLSSLNGGPLSGARNRILNGDMRIDQRNAGATLTNAADGSWAVDRWVRYQNVGASTIGQNLNSVASINGIPNQLGIQITTAGTATSTQYTNFQHYIEGFNAADLAWGTAGAQSITVSFWVRSSVTGTFSFAIQNATSNRGYAANYSISAANTWEYKSVTIPGDTSGTWNTTNGRGIAIIFDLGNGSSFRSTAGSWSGNNVQGATGAVSLNQTLNATWYITGVQLEAGSVATPFERRSYGQELALCQRYYSQSGPSGGFGTITNATDGGIMAIAYSTSEAADHVTFPVAMRVAPTIAICDNSGTFGGRAHIAAGAGNISGVSAGWISTTSWNWLGKTNSWSVGQCIIAGWTATAEL